MAIKFIPNGLLDISTDPSLLPQDTNGKSEFSGAMIRCKNLSLDDNGVAVTRKGSRKLNTTAVDQTVSRGTIEMNGDRYLFAGTKIYKNESSIATGLTSAIWRAILYNAYNVTTQSVFALNGTDRKRITGSTVAEWGIDAPTTAPTLAGIDYVITSTWEEENVTGGVKKFTVRKNGDTAVYSLRDDNDYVYGWEEFYADDSEDHPEVTTATNYAMFYFETADPARFRVTYTYCRKSDDTLECESNPYYPTADSDGVYDYSPMEIYQESGIKITWPASSDSQVTHVRVYRTLAGGVTLYYDSEYAVGDLAATLTKTDSALGSAAEFDHDRPPLGKIVIGPSFNGYVIILKDNLVYYCKANRPEYWPSTNYIEAGPPQFELTAAVLYNDRPYVMNRHEIYLIQGTGAASFFPYPTSSSTGAVFQEAVASVKGQGIYRVASDGIWLFNGAEDKKITEGRLSPIFRGETKGTLPAVNTTAIENCWLLYNRNKLYFGYPGGTSTVPDNIIVMNLQTGKISHYDYSKKFYFVAVDRTNERIIAVDNSGFIWELEDDSITTDHGTAISWELESKSFSDGVYKYFPRYAKYDVDVTNGTANGYVLLNDTAVQTHALTGSRQTKKRHVAGVTGDRLGVRVSGTGIAKIRQVEVE